jgi:hypothetical protein
MTISSRLDGWGPRPPTPAVCPKCADALVVDPRAMADVAATGGLVGGRVCCVACAYDLWLVIARPRPAEPRNPRGRYVRRRRTFICVRCGVSAPTTGVGAKFCDVCRAARGRERDATRAVRRRQERAG